MLLTPVGSLRTSTKIAAMTTSVTSLATTHLGPVQERWRTRSRPRKSPTKAAATPIQMIQVGAFDAWDPKATNQWGNCGPVGPGTMSVPLEYT